MVTRSIPDRACKKFTKLSGDTLARLKCSWLIDSMIQDEGGQKNITQKTTRAISSMPRVDSIFLGKKFSLSSESFKFQCHLTKYFIVIHLSTNFFWLISKQKTIRKAKSSGLGSYAHTQVNFGPPNLWHIYPWYNKLRHKDLIQMK